MDLEPFPHSRRGRQLLNHCSFVVFSCSNRSLTRTMGWSSRAFASAVNRSKFQIDTGSPPQGPRAPSHGMRSAAPVHTPERLATQHKVLRATRDRAAMFELSAHFLYLDQGRE